MSNSSTEVDVPARILAGISGLDQRLSGLGWEGLFSSLIEDVTYGQRRLVAAIDDAVSEQR